MVNMMTSTRSRPRAEGEASRQMWDIPKRCLREKLQEERKLQAVPWIFTAKKLFFSLLASGDVHAREEFLPERMNDIPPDSEDDTTEESRATNEEVKFALKQVRPTATHAPDCATR